MSKEIEEIKEFLLKEYPQFKGFVQHTLVAEMCLKYHESEHIQSKLSELEKEIKNKNKYIETLERAFSEVDLEYYKSLYEQSK